MNSQDNLSEVKTKRRQLRSVCGENIAFGRTTLENKPRLTLWERFVGKNISRNELFRRNVRVHFSQGFLAVSQRSDL